VHRRKSFVPKSTRSLPIEQKAAVIKDYPKLFIDNFNSYVIRKDRPILPGRTWEPPFGLKGRQGSYSFPMRFKGSEGKHDVRSPSRVLIIAELLKFFPED